MMMPDLNLDQPESPTATLSICPTTVSMSSDDSEDEEVRLESNGLYILSSDEESSNEEEISYPPSSEEESSQEVTYNQSFFLYNGIFHNKKY